MTDLWTYLKESQKPKIIYGMGNGADKILSVFRHYGIEADGVFASDDFVRTGKTFQGMPVESYSRICERYDDFIVLVSFATALPDVIENILRISSERELYAPCVPVYGDDVFTYEYYLQHKDRLDEAKALLWDSESKRIFDNIINYRLSGKIGYLLASVSDEDEIWSNILRPDRYRSFADCGAYNGDTALEFIHRCPNAEKIWALEPDPKNYKKLSRIEDSRIFPVNMGAWDKAEKVCFNMGAGRGASQANKGKLTELEFDTLDTILRGECPDYIKYDVEGAESKAITGSENTIKRFSPDLLISLYHRTEDIFELILQIYSIDPEYKLYLRRPGGIPDWDLNLYAVKD